MPRLLRVENNKNTVIALDLSVLKIMKRKRPMWYQKPRCRVAVFRSSTTLAAPKPTTKRLCSFTLARLCRRVRRHSRFSLESISKSNASRNPTNKTSRTMGHDVTRFKWAVEFLRKHSITLLGYLRSGIESICPLSTTFELLKMNLSIVFLLITLKATGLKISDSSPTTTQKAITTGVSELTAEY